MGAGGNTGGNGVQEAGGQQGNQPQGTEYTLQGASSITLGYKLMLITKRCDALPPDRMA